MYEKDFQLFEKKDTPMRFAGLAEAPGGFIQCLVNYRQNKGQLIQQRGWASSAQFLTNKEELSKKGGGLA